MVRKRLTAPLRWAAMVATVPGQERRDVIQAAKAALAVMSAWLLSTEVLHLPQSFLAPYAAVFLVQSTVYRSVLGWAQQVCAMAFSVVLAAAVGQWIPSTTAGIGVAVFVGLLLGTWHRLGESGPWVGITGMLPVSYGSATESTLLWDRLLQTALGAAIGTAVNMLILPPLYGERSRVATDRLGRALGALLDHCADVVRHGAAGAQFDDLTRQAREVDSLVRVAQQASGWSRESDWLNLRRVHRSDGRFERPAAALIAASVHVPALVAALRSAADAEVPFDFPVSGARAELAGLFTNLAAEVRALGEPAHSPDLDSSRRMLEQLNARITDRAEYVPAVAGFAAIFLPARQIIAELD